MELNANQASAEVVVAATAHAEAIEKARATQIIEGLPNSILEVIQIEIAKGIRLNVNGKIDTLRVEIKDHNAKHEQHMVRIMPVIEAFEEGRNDLAAARKGGKIVLWLAATVSAIGGAYLILRAIFFNH